MHQTFRPAAAPAPVRTRPALPARMLGHELAWSLAAVACLIAFVSLKRGAWEYCTTPAAERAYVEAHGRLRPSGTLGHLFGVAGVTMYLGYVPFVS